MCLLVFPVLSFAQMKPQIPTQISPKIPSQKKLPPLGKTYWCVEVKDILFSKEPQEGKKLSVGVRVKFTQKTVIPGAPGQKLCDCAFEGPSDSAKIWSKTMSLRMIGIKYSENETNLLEYYGPTPAFPPYDYSGFQVIGFVVTENDLKKGYIDVWGWASKEPLQCRDATIYASFAIYNQLSYNQENECHPHPDFKKNFKPICLPKIDKEKIEKGAKILIPPDKFFIEKKPSIVFKPFDRSYFKIPATQKTITLKNGNTLTVEEFLAEVNELENKLNKLGYTLRDKEPIEIKYIYPREQFTLQKEMLSKDLLKKITIPLPSQVECEGYSKGHGPEGHPTDFVPLKWEKNWEASFGNNDFGAELTANLKIHGEKNSLDFEPLFNTNILFLGHTVNVLKIYKSGNTLIGKCIGDEFYKQPLHGSFGQNRQKDFDWHTEVGISILDLFKITGILGFKGYAKIHADGRFTSSSADENLGLEIFSKGYLVHEVDIKIVSVKVDADLTVIDYATNLDASVMLTPSSPRYFKFSASEKTDEGTLLNGRLIIHGEIDYLIGSKKFEVGLFNFDGYPLNSPRFSYTYTIPAEKDHHVYLKIDKINGITPDTARGEKLDIEPIGYDLIVDIDGRVSTKTLKDYNKSGIWGDALGEYDKQIFEIPLLSFKKIPISIEVIEKYKIGTLEFKNTLDFAKGPWKKVELCYDPATRTFTGTVSGKEDEKVKAVGDTNYWSESYHVIEFVLTPELFKPAPAKAK